jgi:hypothetical protein
MRAGNFGAHLILSGRAQKIMSVVSPNLAITRENKRVIRSIS